MNGNRPLAKKRHIKDRARVERRILKGAQAGGRSPPITAGEPPHPPAAGGEPGQRRWGKSFHAAIFMIAQGERVAAAIAAQKIIENNAFLIKPGARPLPLAKGPLQRFRAPVHVAIAMAGPVHPGFVHFDLHPHMGVERSPLMAAMGVKIMKRPKGCGQGNGDPAPDGPPPWGAGFMKIGDQGRGGETQAALIDAQALGAGFQPVGAAFGHRPIAFFAIIKGNVKGAVIFRSLPASPRIIGREHTADKNDEGKAIAPIFAQGIAIIPQIAAILQGLVKSRPS